jgi:two-component system response regulator
MSQVILLVEDNPKDLKLTLHVLRSQNLANRIDVARDGQEALDYLFCQGPHANRSFDDPPRVVLLDLKLPGINGLEVLRAVKGDPRTRTIPMVILTASKEETDLVESYHLGVNAYIQKPVDFGQFRQVVDQVGLFWLVVNERPSAPSAGLI